MRVLEVWHLLSLDAPGVAAVWTWFVARADGVRLGWSDEAAMLVAVWVLYAADRLLDARVLDGRAAGDRAGLEERHFFHHRHRRGFLWGIGAACLTLLALLPRLNRHELGLYLLLGALLLGWFGVVHAGRRRLPKEFVVGLFFAAAVFVPTVARRPEAGAEMLVPVLLLAALCCLNCLFLFAWEHEGMGWDDAHPYTRGAARWVAELALVLAAGASGLVREWPAVMTALGLAAALLLGLHGTRHRFARTTLRALADLVLLTPLLLGWWR